MIEVFISFKNTHNNHSTKDQEIAQSLYNSLIKNGINTFFSNNSLAENGVSEYKIAIDAALSEAQILILAGTNCEFITSKWVQYEWNTFQQEILSERKQKGKIFTLLDTISISDLPISLRSLQSFDIAKNNIDYITNYIKNSIETLEKRVITHDLSDGIFAYYGINQRIEYKKAFEILSNFKDNNIALYILGQIYYYGNVGKKDYEKATELFNLSYEMGNIIAGYKLAENYKNGIGSDIKLSRHDEIRELLTSDYSNIIKNINKSNLEYVNNLIYIGKTTKNQITKEAILAIEIKTVLDFLNIEVEMFDVDVNNEEKINRISEISSERNLFIFSTLRNINDRRMETIWKSMFSSPNISFKTAITHISEIQIHDLPVYLRKTPFIIRDATSMSKIVGFFMKKE
jgi:hypothetical protein